MSGLLPRNPGPPSGAGGSGFFSSLTVGSLIVTGLASLGSLLVSGATTLTGILSVASSVWSDVYANFTTGHTVTLQTRSANANVLLSPNGSGQVVVSAATALTADFLSPTSAGPLTLTTPAAQSIMLTAGTGGSVTVPNLVPLHASLISPTTGGTALALSTTTGANILLSPAGAVVVSTGRTLEADIWASTTAATSLNIQPTGAFVTITGGKSLTVDTISPTSAAPLTLTTASGQNVNLSPVGTASVVVASGKTLTADTLSSTTAATNLDLTPTGGFVLVAAGKALAVDSIGPTTAGALAVNTTANGNLNLSPNGTGLVNCSNSVIVPATAPLPRFEIGPGNQTVFTLGYVNSNGQYFTGTGVGDIVLRNATAPTTTWIGGNGSAAAPFGVNYTTGVIIQGAAAADTSTKLLALNGSNVVVYQDTLSGQFTATWTPVTGFSGAVTATINYVRLGNVVTCSGTVVNVTTAVGANTATLSLPIARSANFVATAGASGSFIWSSTVGLATQAELIANTATTNLIIVGFSSTGITSGTTIYLSFVYQLVL